MKNVLNFPEVTPSTDLPQLEKNIPLPGSPKNSKHNGKWQRLIFTSCHGDSLLVTEYQRTAIVKANRKLGNPRKIISRAADDVNYTHPNGQIRIWFLVPGQENNQ